MTGKASVADELKPTNRRVESFSDAVFAIVVTIMMIEIHIPDSFALTTDWGNLAPFGAVLLTYALSFYVIVNLWVSHHYLLFTLANPARSTIWYNNLLLFTVSLIPIVTQFLGMHPNSPRATALYGLVAVLCTASFMLLRRHAARRTHNELHRGIHMRVLRRTWLFIAIYAVSIPLSFFSPWLAWICFLIVPPMLFLPVISARGQSMDMAEQHAAQRSCP